MFGKRPRIWLVEQALLEAFAKLTDVAPTEFTVLSEESDWWLVGGDLRDAMELVESEIAQPAPEDHEELVEA